MYLLKSGIEESLLISMRKCINILMRCLEWEQLGDLIVPWVSAVVLIRKKDGALRFCIDLRKLNERTIKDAYSLPRIEDSLDVLNGLLYFYINQS